MKRTPYICTACGFAGFPAKVKQGSTGLNILLYCLFFFPGLFYSLWRAFAPKFNRCVSCQAMNTMIPLESIKGQKLADELLSAQRKLNGEAA
jgi:hypothetical protein